MKLLKFLYISVCTILLLAGSCMFYAFKIEPYRITANKTDLNEKSSDFVRVVQFSDVHIKEDFTYKNLDKIVNKINKQNPDVVVFTGDLYDNYAEYHEDDLLIKELQKINAKYDKIAIWGNRDYGGGAARQYENIMTQSGFTVLKNGNWYVTTEPDTADSFQEYPYDLILSGHSHGGQVNIPFFPAVNQAAVSFTALTTNYAGGMYELNADTKLYVNTGIGTTHISARFGVVPEISVFTIYL